MSFESLEGSTSLYSAAQVAEIDQTAIERFELPAEVLMKRAGRVAFKTLLECWPEVQTLHIFCGSGNNAGDGYVIAALAKQRNLNVQLWYLSEPEKLQGAASTAWTYALQEGVNCQVYQAETFDGFAAANPETTVVVDALLGTGSRGELRPEYAQAVRVINESQLDVLAVDIPSGVAVDTGAVLSEAVKADVTVSFVGQKLGLFTGKGRVHTGERVFSNLGVPSEAYDGAEVAAELIDYQEWLPLLPSREDDFHKGDCGHLLVVGGDAGTSYGYGGAAIMASQMALRSGAGLVSVATRPCFVVPALMTQPEMMVAGIESGQALLPLLEKASVIAVGPGLGQSSWSEQLLYHVLLTDNPLVIDADALHLLVKPEFAQLSTITKTERQWILTPHPGEAAALLSISTAEVQQDRVTAAQAIQREYGGAVILKGAGTVVVGRNGDVWVCDQGNAGMASGGMGDVLTGLLGSLLAQGMTVDAAAVLGVALHAHAADIAVGVAGERGLLATDLIPYIQELLS